MRLILFTVLLGFNTAANACPMADAAAYRAEVQKVEAAKGTQLAFSIKGMTCGSCSEKISAALNGVNGVMAAAVDYQTGEARVAYDASKTDQKALLAAIEATGFKAKTAKADS